jgi:hypothetical protein
MHIRTMAVAIVLAAAATLPLAGIASAADRDCKDFSSQAEAQAALRAGDPENLDLDKDGIACETQFGEPTGDDSSEKADEKADDKGQIRTVPRGSVDTGDGSTAPDPAPALLIVAGMAAIGTAVAVRRGMHSSR